jgi:predicted HAD superfamily phosphohydrolase YqeG
MLHDGPCRPSGSHAALTMPSRALMEPFAKFPAAARAKIQFVLTDIDETLTNEGQLSEETVFALERLQQAGLKVIPVTDGSAGWCDLIAQMCPVNAVIGENGGFCFCRGSIISSLDCN